MGELYWGGKSEPAVEQNDVWRAKEREVLARKKKVGGQNGHESGVGGYEDEHDQGGKGPRRSK